MSDKHGSEERKRDPGTPDPLADRLAAERARRREARERSAQERALTTPMSAAQSRVSLSSLGPDNTDMSARKILRYEYPPGSPEKVAADAAKALATPPPKKVWEGLLELNHQDFLLFMKAQGANESLLQFMTDMEMDGACWRMAISDANSTEVRADIEAAIAEWAGGKSSPGHIMKITMSLRMRGEGLGEGEGQM